jgi:L-threonine kinase
MTRSAPARPGRRTPTRATATGRAFGTFGEILQGRLPDNDIDFLVTLPIAAWSEASVTLDRHHRGVHVVPHTKCKAQRLAQRLMAIHARGWGATLTLRSDLPEGKGMASSSADLVATARAVARMLGLNATPLAIEGWLRPIEPTDGVMYPGVVAFDHRDVRLRAFLGTLPPVTIVGVDEGGQVDTVAFNRIPKSFRRAEQVEYANLLATVATAVRAGDLTTIGAVATRSTLLHARRRHRPLLRPLLAIARDVGAHGVVTAHSGTMLGLLFDERDPALPARVGAARSACEALAGTVQVFRSADFHRAGERDAP